jgi:hypothetical protein
MQVCRRRLIPACKVDSLRYAMDKTDGSRSMILTSSDRPLWKRFAIYQYRYLVVSCLPRPTNATRDLFCVAWTMLNPLGTMIILTIVFRVFGANKGLRLCVEWAGGVELSPNQLTPQLSTSSGEVACSGAFTCRARHSPCPRRGQAW